MNLFSYLMKQRIWTLKISSKIFDLLKKPQNKFRLAKQYILYAVSTGNKMASNFGGAVVWNCNYYDQLKQVLRLKQLQKLILFLYTGTQYRVCLKSHWSWEALIYIPLSLELSFVDKAFHPCTGILIFQTRWESITL